MKPSCEQCHQIFEVSPEQSALLNKLAPVFAGRRFTIPHPRLCPPCRKQRRLLFRNDLCLYERGSDLSKKRIISIYPEGTPFPVFENSEWWSDSWDPLDYGSAYYDDRPFFDQFLELRNRVPRVNLYVDNLCENSRFSNQITMSKNCYLLFSGSGAQECHYCYRCVNSQSCVDCLFIVESELCFECIDAVNSYNCCYSQHVTDCSECSFVFDCQGCSNCFLSYGLRNKRWCVLNQQYTEQEYRRLIGGHDFGSRTAASSLRKQFNGFLKDFPKRFAYLKQTENVRGDNIQNAKNCSFVFDGGNLEDVHYAQFIQDTRDAMDVNYCCDNTELHYDVCTSGINAYQVLFSVDTWPGVRNLIYCDSCSNNTRDCFGCVGLRGKQYCILNRQYSRDDYEALAARILEALTRSGEWGEFLPARLSPFSYNESVAAQYFVLTKKEALAQGFRWRDEEQSKRAQTSLAADNIKDVGDEVISAVFSCSTCGRAYRIASEELKFYRRQILPLPAECFFCRHARRLKTRNPRDLWQRECVSCKSAVYTSYPPESKEQVLCEGCYLKALY